MTKKPLQLSTQTVRVLVDRERLASIDVQHMPKIVGGARAHSLVICI